MKRSQQLQRGTLQLPLSLLRQSALRTAGNKLSVLTAIAVGLTLLLSPSSSSLLVSASTTDTATTVISSDYKHLKNQQRHRAFQAARLQEQVRAFASQQALKQHEATEPTGKAVKAEVETMTTVDTSERRKTSVKRALRARKMQGGGGAQRGQTATSSGANLLPPSPSPPVFSCEDIARITDQAIGISCSDILKLFPTTAGVGRGPPPPPALPPKSQPAPPPPSPPSPANTQIGNPVATPPAGPARATSPPTPPVTLWPLTLPPQADTTTTQGTTPFSTAPTTAGTMVGGIMSTHGGNMGQQGGAVGSSGSWAAADQQQQGAKNGSPVTLTPSAASSSSSEPTTKGTGASNSPNALQDDGNPTTSAIFYILLIVSLSVSVAILATMMVIYSRRRAQKRVQMMEIVAQFHRDEEEAAGRSVEDVEGSEEEPQHQRSNLTELMSVRGGAMTRSPSQPYQAYRETPNGTITLLSAPAVVLFDEHADEAVESIAPLSKREKRKGGKKRSKRKRSSARSPTRKAEEEEEPPSPPDLRLPHPNVVIVPLEATPPVRLLPPVELVLLPSSELAPPAAAAAEEAGDEPPLPPRMPSYASTASVVL